MVPDHRGFQLEDDDWSFEPPTDGYTRMVDGERYSRDEAMELADRHKRQKNRMLIANEIRFLRESSESGDKRPSAVAHAKWAVCRKFIDGIDGIGCRSGGFYDQSRGRGVIQQLQATVAGPAAFDEYWKTEGLEFFDPFWRKYAEDIKKQERRRSYQHDFLLERQARDLFAGVELVPDGSQDVCERNYGTNLLKLLQDGKGDWEWRVERGELQTDSSLEMFLYLASMCSHSVQRLFLGGSFGIDVGTNSLRDFRRDRNATIWDEYTYPTLDHTGVALI